MSNKYNFGGKSIYDKPSQPNQIFYYAVVDSNDDPSDGSRIKARIKGIDDSKTTSDLPYAFPLIQKFFHAVPKIGETVLILAPDLTNPNIDRMYIGPIISQPQYLNYDPDLYTSKSLLDSGYKTPASAPSTIPENRGVYPNKKDISIQGRNNSDLIFKDNEVVLRAGKFEIKPKSEVGEIPKFNKDNPAYIQLKHNITIDKEKNIKGSVTNIVANKINLLTHKDGEPRFVLNDQDSLISDDEMNKILKEAHQLVFGDLLVDYLILMRNAFINHVHAYHGKKAQDLSGAEDIDKFLNFDLSKLLSKNIRIN